MKAKNGKIEAVDLGGNDDDEANGAALSKSSQG